MRLRVAQLDAQVALLDVHIAGLQAQIARRDDDIAKLNIDVNNFVNSTSLRVTAPLRCIQRYIGGVPVNRVKVAGFSLFRKVFSVFLREVMKFVNTSPRIRSFIILFFNRLGLLNTVKRFYYKVSTLEFVRSDTAHKKNKTAHLAISPNSRKVLSDLQREIKKLKGEV